MKSSYAEMFQYFLLRLEHVIFVSVEEAHGGFLWEQSSEQGLKSLTA